MSQIVVTFTLGVIILLLSTQWFLKAAERMSLVLRVSPLIIGLTVVSIGTSLPELAVSAIAVFNGDSGLATGNIIGSNIINVFLVFGIGILLGKLRVGTQKTQKNIYMMCGITAVFLLLYFLHVPNVLSGIILLLAALVVSIQEYVWGIKGRKFEDAVLYLKNKRKRGIPLDIIMIGFSVVGIIAGGMLTVSSVERLSALLDISTTILGLSVTAIATSLPELLTTLFSEKDHEEKITIGNLMGSNIYNLALIGGLILLFSPWKSVTSYESVMLILATFAFTITVAIYKGKVIPKGVGLIFLGMCVGYLFFLQ
ncbi:MAG: sodium:calcium antiporter [Patescibacteria group bacterium]|jgi:cation:H+ antiporter